MQSQLAQQVAQNMGQTASQVGNQAASAGGYGFPGGFSDPSNTTVFIGGLSAAVGDDELRR
jgi:hypothetical protein